MSDKNTDKNRFHDEISRGINPEKFFLLLFSETFVVPFTF